MSAKVTSVTTTMSETDLMENIREFVEVEGLTIHNLEFKHNSIEVTGNFKKIIDIPFFASVHVASVAANIVRIKIERIKVLKVGLPNALLAGAMSFAEKKVEDLGITYEDGHIVVDVDEVLKKQPHVHVSLDNIIMENGLLAIKVSNIEADVKAIQEEQEEKKQAENDEEAEEEFEEAIRQEELRNFNINLSHIEPSEDEYSRFRRDIEKRVPIKRQQIFEYASAVPDILALAVRVLKDRRVLVKDKVIIGASMGYFLSPIDIVPKKIPVLNKMDDVALFVFGVKHLLNRIPLPIVVEHWAGDLRALKMLKDNIDIVMNPTGASLVDRGYEAVEEKLDEKYGEYMDDDFYFNDPVAPLSVPVGMTSGPPSTSSASVPGVEPVSEPMDKNVKETGSDRVSHPVSGAWNDPAVAPVNEAAGDPSLKPSDVPGNTSPL